MSRDWLTTQDLFLHGKNSKCADVVETTGTWLLCPIRFPKLFNLLTPYHSCFENLSKHCWNAIKEVVSDVEPAFTRNHRGVNMKTVTRLLGWRFNKHVHMYTHTHIYTLSFQMRQYKLLYSLKGHLTEYQQRWAESRPNIITLCKRTKLSLSTFEWELRTLSATLILLYNFLWFF